MALRRGFWTGIVIGAGAGAALLRIFKLLSTPASSMRSEWSVAAPPNTRRGTLQLKRDQGGGDPADLTSSRTGASAGFTRAGGAPGGTGQPESSEVPGRPGQQISYTDPSAPVRPSSRTSEIKPKGR